MSNPGERILAHREARLGSQRARGFSPGGAINTFDVQSIEIAAPFSTVFQFIAEPANLPRWTHAFKSVAEDQAIMETPAGSVRVRIHVAASEVHGTVDWTITFPDGSVAKAASRVVPHAERSIYTFVLEAPPVPLERLEGALAAQSRILTQELETLARLVAAVEPSVSQSAETFA